MPSFSELESAAAEVSDVVGPFEAAPLAFSLFSAAAAASDSASFSTMTSLRTTFSPPPPLVSFGIRTFTDLNDGEFGLAADDEAVGIGSLGIGVGVLVVVEVGVVVLVADVDVVDLTGVF